MLSYNVARGEFSSRELSDSTLYSHPVASFLASFCLVGASWAATVACQFCLHQQPPLELFPLLMPPKPVTSWRRPVAGSFHLATLPSSPGRPQVRWRHLVPGAPRPWPPAAPRERSAWVPGWLRPERARSLRSPPRLLAPAAARTARVASRWSSGQPALARAARARDGPRLPTRADGLVGSFAPPPPHSAAAGRLRGARGRGRGLRRSPSSRLRLSQSVSQSVPSNGGRR